jgi:hypothetical protein
MRQFLIASFIILMMTQCGTRSKLPAGAPTSIKTGHLMDSIAAAQNTQPKLVVKYQASVSSPSMKQSFRMEVRLLRDSLIWLDVADPILGIKVARALVFKDSVAFISRLNREYFTGNIKGLQERFGFAFDFSDLQAIFYANVVPRAFNPESLKQYAYANAYLLADYPQSPEEQAKMSALQERFTRLLFEPGTYKASMQEQREPVNGKAYTFLCEGFSKHANVFYPAQLKLEYAAREQTTLSLQVQRVDTPAKLNFPFSIPDSYAPMR